MYDLKAQEGTIINCVASDYFAEYDCRNLIGKIDFSVAVKKDKQDLFQEPEFLLWAEAKQGNHHSIRDSFIQLILTIGKERTYDKYMPPCYIGAFDAEKLIGIIGIRPDRKHICFFFVDGKYQRQGIGTRLFKTVLQDYPEQTITVNSSPYGVPFYHALGFENTDKEQTVNGIRYTPMQREVNGDGSRRDGCSSVPTKA